MILVFSACNSAGFIVAAAYGLGGSFGAHVNGSKDHSLEAYENEAISVYRTYKVVVGGRLTSRYRSWRTVLSYIFTVWPHQGVRLIALQADPDIRLDQESSLGLHTRCCPHKSRGHRRCCHGMRVDLPLVYWLLVFFNLLPRRPTAVRSGTTDFLMLLPRLVDTSAQGSEGDANHESLNEDFLFTSVSSKSTRSSCACIKTPKPLLNRVFASSARQEPHVQDHQLQMSQKQQRLNPCPPPLATIGSEPSRRKEAGSSWARMDRSRCQTVQEEVNLRRSVAATRARSCRRRIWIGVGGAITRAS